ncbi:MAG: MFS transporter [Acidimicrobiia bacterium]|nr:MFS transporter [Acidimicrobiia bacterium]
MNRRRIISISALGLVAIAAYGAWFYSFGVLLDPIIVDTGWSETGLTAGFGVGMAVGGVLALPAGRLLDHVGSRPMFLFAAVVSTSALWVGASATSLMPFLVMTGLANATLSALGFYHITQTTAVRVAPDEPAKAIALLTIYGAFASAIFLPLAAYLVETSGWRTTTRVLGLIVGVVLAVAAVVVKEEERADRTLVRAGVRAGLRDPTVRKFSAAVALSGVMAGVLLVYQVPLMTAAGLPLATASWFAGARGAAQLTGRLPLAFIVRRLGERRSLILAYSSSAIGVVLLAFSGNVLVASAFALAAGFGIGAASALQGIYADVVFDRSELGAMMGFLTLLGGLSGAAGPAAAGALADITGTRIWALVIAGVSGVAAVGLLRASRDHTAVP